MRPDPVHINIPDCAQIEHHWLGTLLEKSFNLQEHAEVMNNLINTKLQGVLDMRVSAPHYPCTLVQHRIHVTQYTDVAGAFTKLSQQQGVCPQKLA